MAKKHLKEIIFVGGKNHESYFINKGSEFATRVDFYMGVLLPHNEDFTERVILTPENNKVVFIVSRKHRVSTVLTVDEKDGVAEKNEDLINVSHEFKGVLVLFFHCLGEEDSYHMVYADSRDKTYKSMCFECFGYEKDFVFEMGKAILSASKMCLPNDLIEINNPNHYSTIEEKTSV